jgi:hypothetical protein
MRNNNLLRTIENMKINENEKSTSTKDSKKVLMDVK